MSFLHIRRLPTNDKILVGVTADGQTYFLDEAGKCHKVCYVVKEERHLALASAALKVVRQELDNEKNHDLPSAIIPSNNQFNLGEIKKWAVTTQRVPTNYNNCEGLVVEAVTEDDAVKIAADHLRDFSTMMYDSLRPAWTSSSHVYKVKPYVVPPPGRVLGSFATNAY